MTKSGQLTYAEFSLRSEPEISDKVKWVIMFSVR